MQTALVGLGHMSGGVDGIAGRGTAQAAASFARAQAERQRQEAAEHQRQADADATRRHVADAADRAGNTARNAKNYAEARQLYTKACDGGNMSGCKNLGYMYPVSYTHLTLPTTPYV